MNSSCTIKDKLLIFHININKKQSGIPDKITVLTYCGIRHDDHYVSVGCEDVNKCGEVLVADFHSLESGC